MWSVLPVGSAMTGGWTPREWDRKLVHKLQWRNTKHWLIFTHRHSHFICFSKEISLRWCTRCLWNWRHPQQKIPYMFPAWNATGSFSTGLRWRAMNKSYTTCSSIQSNCEEHFAVYGTVTLLHPCLCLQSELWRLKLWRLGPPLQTGLLSKASILLKGISLTNCWQLSEGKSVYGHFKQRHSKSLKGQPLHNVGTGWVVCIRMEKKWSTQS